MTEAPMNQLRKVHIIQGEYHIEGGDNVVLSTVLGSCVAACLRDPATGVGGMNHFLLPGARSACSFEAERYGAYLMELLINALFQKGCRRDRIEAKLFGGAKMVEGLSDIGEQNAKFAREFLQNEGIRIVAEDLGGTHGRRLEYFPRTGRARQILLPHAIHLTDPTKRSNRFDSLGNVELF